MALLTQLLDQVGGPLAAAYAKQQQADPFTLALQASIQAQKDANAIAAAASVPQQDSESARAAADDQRRRLTQGSNFGIGLQTTLGAPPVGFRMLSGQ